MSSKKMPINSSLIALPPAGADIGFWALTPKAAAARATLRIDLLYIVVIIVYY
jgi:hypothetical protein